MNPPEIEALSQNRIKFLLSLQRKKMRQKYDKFVVEGDKMVAEALKQNRFRVSSIIAVPDWYTQQEVNLKKNATPIQLVKERDLKKVSSFTTPNQVLAVLDIPKPTLPDPLGPSRLNLFLDGVQQPANLGAILRVADWFGVEKVICSPTTVDPYNPKSVQASMGAILRVRMESSTLSDWQQRWPNCPIYLADGRGEDIRSKSLPLPALLVLGAEAAGVSDEAHALSTHLLAISRHAEGQAESLNVAVAAGILVSHWETASH